ncbi:MAG: sugar transferase, partial [Pseudomonadota bacterium]
MAREWEATRKLRVDPRITRLGRILREYSVDELPQLINVLRGEMSIVGPRPVVAAELDRYGAEVDHYLAARPGITGLWQVSGRSDTTYRERVELDCQYVSDWSFSGDIAIILRTVPAILSARGAC